MCVIIAALRVRVSAKTTKPSKSDGVILRLYTRCHTNGRSTSSGSGSSTMRTRWRRSRRRRATTSHYFDKSVWRLRCSMGNSGSRNAGYGGPIKKCIVHIEKCECVQARMCADLRRERVCHAESVFNCAHASANIVAEIIGGNVPVCASSS